MATPILRPSSYSMLVNHAKKSDDTKKLLHRTDFQAKPNIIEFKTLTDGIVCLLDLTSPNDKFLVFNGNATGINKDILDQGEVMPDGGIRVKVNNVNCSHNMNLEFEILSSNSEIKYYISSNEINYSKNGIENVANRSTIFSSDTNNDELINYNLCSNFLDLINGNPPVINMSSSLPTQFFDAYKDTGLVKTLVVEFDNHEINSIIINGQLYMQHSSQLQKVESIHYSDSKTNNNCCYVTFYNKNGKPEKVAYEIRFRNSEKNISNLNKMIKFATPAIKTGNRPLSVVSYPTVAIMNAKKEIPQTKLYRQSPDTNRERTDVNQFPTGIAVGSSIDEEPTQIKRYTKPFETPETPTEPESPVDEPVITEEPVASTDETENPVDEPVVEPVIEPAEEPETPTDDITPPVEPVSAEDPTEDATETPVYTDEPVISTDETEASVKEPAITEEAVVSEDTTDETESIVEEPDKTDVKTDAGVTPTAISSDTTKDNTTSSDGESGAASSSESEAATTSETEEKTTSETESKTTSETGTTTTSETETNASPFPASAKTKSQSSNENINNQNSKVKKDDKKDDKKKSPIGRSIFTILGVLMIALCVFVPLLAPLGIALIMSPFIADSILDFTPKTKEQKATDQADRRAKRAGKESTKQLILEKTRDLNLDRLSNKLVRISNKLKNSLPSSNKFQHNFVKLQKTEDNFCSNVKKEYLKNKARQEEINNYFDEKYGTLDETIELTKDELDLRNEGELIDARQEMLRTRFSNFESEQNEFRATIGLPPLNYTPFFEEPESFSTAASTEATPDTIKTEPTVTKSEHTATETTPAAPESTLDDTPTLTPTPEEPVNSPFINIQEARDIINDKLLSTIETGDYKTSDYLSQAIVLISDPTVSDDNKEHLEKLSEELRTEYDKAVEIAKKPVEIPILNGFLAGLDAPEDAPAEKIYKAYLNGFVLPSVFAKQNELKAVIDSIKEPTAEETTEIIDSEEPSVEPVIEETPVVEETPVIEDIPAEPVVDETPVEPVVEDASIVEDAPTEEEITPEETMDFYERFGIVRPIEAPIEEELSAEPVVEDSPTEPVVEEVPVVEETPVAEDVPAELVIEETPVVEEATVIEDIPAEPVVEETPVIDDTPTEPITEPVIEDLSSLAKEVEKTTIAEDKKIKKDFPGIEDVIADTEFTEEQTSPEVISTLGTAAVSTTGLVAEVVAEKKDTPIKSEPETTPSLEVVDEPIIESEEVSADNESIDETESLEDIEIDPEETDFTAEDYQELDKIIKHLETSLNECAKIVYKDSVITDEKQKELQKEYDLFAERYIELKAWVDSFNTEEENRVDDYIQSHKDDVSAEDLEDLDNPTIEVEEGRLSEWLDFRNSNVGMTLKSLKSDFEVLSAELDEFLINASIISEDIRKKIKERKLKIADLKTINSALLVAVLQSASPASTKEIVSKINEHSKSGFSTKALDSFKTGKFIPTKKHIKDNDIELQDATLLDLLQNVADSGDSFDKPEEYEDTISPLIYDASQKPTETSSRPREIKHTPAPTTTTKQTNNTKGSKKNKFFGGGKE